MQVSWLTPPDIGKRLRVKAGKVLAWIRCGELVAVNLAERRGGRPRWRVSSAALDDFLAARSCRPAATPVRRRRKQPVEPIQFF
jgi:hypothetical protein